MPSRIFLKLLISFLCSLTTLVVVIALIINYSFQQGFTDYLQEKEIRLVNAMIPFLSSHFQRQKNWQLMYQNHHLWNEALISANIAVPPPPPRIKRRPPPINQQSHTEGAKKRHFEPHLAMRIGLYDQGRNVIFGPPTQPKSGHWEGVYVDALLVGQLYLSPSDLRTDDLANSFLEQQQKNFLYIALIIIFFSTLLASVWARFLQRPINKIIHAFKKLAAGQYSIRVTTSGSDEFTQLGINFNQMAQALEQNETLRGQWLTDISHELRTPLSVIRGEIEALLDGLREPTLERINSLYEETAALTQLIDDLHMLSLADNQALNLKLEYCDPHKIIEHQIRLFQFRMEKKGLTLLLQNKLKTNVKMYVDPRRISQVFNNLLENSLRYTDKKGKVNVSIFMNDGLLIFSICDSTPGVSDTDLNKIFDRLFCADKSRSRSVGGSGLGLAICKSIITAHQGSIFAEHNNKGGLCIKIKLPCVHHSLK